MKPSLLIAVSLFASAAYAAPPIPDLPNDQLRIIEVHRGAVLAKFDKFQQWNNATKEFWLTRDVDNVTTGRKLGWSSVAAYRELEKNDGNVVRMRLIPVHIPGQTIWLFVDLEVITPDKEPSK